MPTKGRQSIVAPTATQGEEDDFFLKAIKNKGFCHVSRLFKVNFCRDGLVSACWRTSVSHWTSYNPICTCIWSTILSPVKTRIRLHSTWSSNWLRAKMISNWSQTNSVTFGTVLSRTSKLSQSHKCTTSSWTISTMGTISSSSCNHKRWSIRLWTATLATAKKYRTLRIWSAKSSEWLTSSTQYLRRKPWFKCTNKFPLSQVSHTLLCKPSSKTCSATSKLTTRMVLVWLTLKIFRCSACLNSRNWAISLPISLVKWAEALINQHLIRHRSLRWVQALRKMW